MKAKGDANNDWVVSHRLIMNNNIGGGATVEYEDVKKIQELYLGGLRDTETLIPSKQMLLDLMRNIHVQLLLADHRMIVIIF